MVESGTLIYAFINKHHTPDFLSKRKVLEIACLTRDLTSSPHTGNSHYKYDKTEVTADFIKKQWTSLWSLKEGSKI
jgi:hypothetical protein